MYIEVTKIYLNNYRIKYFSIKIIKENNTERILINKRYLT